MCNLYGLARVSHKEVATLAYRALVNAKHGQLANIRVDTRLEHVRYHVFAGVWTHLDPLRVGAFAFEERRRVAFGWVRHEPRENPQQLRDARAGLRGNETDGDEVALAQRLLKRVVELLRGELGALLQVEGHELLVELNDLVDDLRVRGRDRGEIGGS